MHKHVRSHLQWTALLALASACGDDGASATSMGSDSDSATEGSSSGEPGTITVADSSGSSSASASASATGDSSSSGSDSGGPACGNDVREGDEVCDGSDVGDATCESEGFVGGTLACNAQCDGFDTSGCTSCGNGMIDAREDCDGDDLGDNACTDLGFDEGTLACDASCVFDTSACVAYSCGDGAINGETEECDGTDLNKASCDAAGFGAGEVSCTDRCVLDFTACCGDGNVGGSETCDGDDLAGNSCATQGDFDGGVLGCSEACDGFDVSGCTLCGDGAAQGSEQCDGDDLLGNDCTTVPGGFVGGSLACAPDCGFDTSGCNFCGNDIVDAGEQCDGTALDGADCLTLGHTGGVLGCDAACGYDESQCTDFPLPGVEAVAITEIMRDPSSIPDPGGEWFEIYNPSLTETYQLRGCLFQDDGVDNFDITSDLVIGPGELRTFGRSDNPGFVPDYVYDGLALGNSADELELFCVGNSVDRVAYDDMDFPDVSGAAMQVDPVATNAVDNDNGSNWCAAMTPYFMTDLGTPGLANDSCSPPTYAIDYCNLQFPTSIDDLEGAGVDVFGRLYIAGLTDQSNVNDPAVNVVAAVGYGPDGTDPSLDMGWVWTAAAPNPGWVGMGFPDANNDEYVGTMTLPLPGDYDFAYRFSGDGGLTFTYCDGTGSTDGYAAADAGQMTTSPAGDPTVLFFSEYYEGTSNNKVLELYNPSAQSVNLAACQIRTYANGAVVPGSSLPLVGLVLPGEVFTVCHTSLAAQPFCDQLASLAFNGNDALELYCDMTTVDVIGQLGFNPGAEWAGGGTGTLDEDLRRNCNVTAGDTNGADAFDPSLQWTGLPIIAANPQPENIDDLGEWNCP
ncbi:MAG: hypothetical protein K1X88_04715 [Nannocystaceae bacterium]|nr:hypothetical protein [Nannocystaceae bacterium]